MQETLSVTTDYATDQGCPQPALRAIAETGFTHIHWCHQWNTDFLYVDSEIRAIEAWMKQYHLTLTDLHASDGKEKRWTSALDYEREAGVDLVKNRIAMTDRLGGDVIIMHLGSEPESEQAKQGYWDALAKSLDELEPVSRFHDVQIALENGRFPMIRRVLEEYDPSYLGLCYDCGHGNMDEKGLDELDSLKDRLISVHLHDNDGTSDQHKLPFTGTVDWNRLARILASSSYKKPMSFEVSMRNSGIQDESLFLKEAFDAARRFSSMVKSQESK